MLEEELHIEILPGTEVMADIGSHHFVKSGDRSHRVLVPQPSNDKHDPLNWSLKWKIAAIVAAHSVTFTQGFGPLSLAPMFPDYIAAFHTSLASAVQFTGVAILVLGFSNFLWVPISSSFGRRPAYIFSQLICFGACIWRARANSYNSFMGACVLNGIGAGPAETIQPAVIADIFFLHDRGKWNTLYWVVYMGSLMIAPIISGPMAASVRNLIRIAQTSTYLQIQGWLAKLLVAQRSYTGSLNFVGYLPFPRDQVGSGHHWRRFSGF